MHCSNCSTENIDSAKFCKNCGTAIDSPKQESAVSGAVAASGGNKKTALDFYLTAWRKCAVFEGRAQRAEYWYFVLFTLIIDAALAFVYSLFPSFRMLLYVLYLVYSLGIVIPSISVAMRRLHDIGKSGWMYWISVIPLIGSIWLLVLLVTDSNSETNKYGPNPKRN